LIKNISRGAFIVIESKSLMKIFLKRTIFIVIKRYFY